MTTEYICAKCGETVVTFDDDIEHIERERDGDECGGDLVPVRAVGHAMTDLLTAQEAAEYLGPPITAAQLRRYARIGRIRTTRTPGGGYRYDRAALDLFRALNYPPKDAA